MTLREQVARAIHSAIARAMGPPYMVHPEWTEYADGHTDDIQLEALDAADAVLALVKAVLDEQAVAPPLDWDNSARGGWEMAVEQIARDCGVEL